ncbi:hypothetical protein [Chryseobacterium oncorhynchi]|uniref:Uncharacterized protein n=1 Tax=Chryseobacterium oncorhynchi TaxID=741074 RepID=A0A316WWG7_9FLAO|nr:hypothetical protein [Chryseobacterium oncorhynchi]PWN65882.1 hypothetical protein C1638_005715 [Chryseobacterium oncorhynchi]
MENQEELEAKFMDLVKEYHKKTGGNNGLNLYKLDEKLNISFKELLVFVERLMKEKKIVYLNHLNGRTVTLPK